MKSHVSLEQKQCLVCGKVYDTGGLLLDKRLKASMEMHTITGTGMCEEHQGLADKGYIALVEIDPSKSHPRADGTMDPEHAYRTGRILHLRKSVMGQIFHMVIPEGTPLAFVEPAVIEYLLAQEKARVDYEAEEGGQEVKGTA